MSYEDTDCYEWLSVISKRSVWPQWSTRCVQSLRNLCKPAITGIIGMCATHHQGFTTLNLVVRLCEICVRCTLFLFCSCGCRLVMDVSIYCSKQISQPFIHPQHSANQPLPPEQLLAPFLLYTHWHTLSHPNDSIPLLLMAPGLHASSWGDRIQSSSTETAQCLLIHADWRLVILGV